MSEALGNEKLGGSIRAAVSAHAMRRRSLLELAPLEMDCMNALWPMGEATVRDIRASLASRRPRAYTTIMTIMDRLARKGIVERRRAGRAWLYRANLTAEDARAHAVNQVVESFFGGSAAALAAQLEKPAPLANNPRQSRPVPAPIPDSSPRDSAKPQPPPRRGPSRELPERRIDETLL